VEYGAGCGSRPDMLGSPDPGRWSCRTQARSPPRQTVPSCGRLGCGVRGGLCPLPRELEVGLWGTGRAVPRRAARPLSGDMIVEHGVSCDSRPDMLESRLPQEI
jgi:hypothetical protein